MRELNHFHRVAYMMLQLFSGSNVILLPTLNVVYCYVSTCRSICAVPSRAVFCSSVLCCPGTLLRYYYYYYYGCEVLRNLYKLI